MPEKDAWPLRETGGPTLASTAGCDKSSSMGSSLSGFLPSLQADIMWPLRHLPCWTPSCSIQMPPIHQAAFTRKPLVLCRTNWSPRGSARPCPLSRAWVSCAAQESGTLEPAFKTGLTLAFSASDAEPADQAYRKDNINMGVPCLAYLDAGDHLKALHLFAMRASRMLLQCSMPCVNDRVSFLQVYSHPSKQSPQAICNHGAICSFLV